jgi:hypothetical protein
MMTDYQTKAFAWWRSLSINEMKALEKKYNLLCIGYTPSLSDIVAVFEQEIENKPK